MSEQEEKAQVDAWLCAKGIRHPLDSLFDDPHLCGDCTAELLELLKSAFSLSVRTCAARAFFSRKPSPAQKQDAVEVLLAIFRDNVGQDNHCLSTLAVNELADNIEPDRVDEIVQMTLDRRYGPLRSAFTHVLFKIRTPAAIDGLQRAARDPVISSAALYKLARLKVPGTLGLCEEALKIPGLLHVETVKETYGKLKRDLTRRAGTVSHVTKDPIPKGFKEWSVNLDGSDLSTALRGIQKSVEEGFAQSEITEVRSAAEDLSVGEDVRFKFKVKLVRKETTLWLELFCDDEDAYDLYAFGISELVDRIEKNERNVA